MVNPKLPSGVKFESRGWETFDEFPGKRGIRQNILTTIEFGLSPFVPMSEQYMMDYGNLPGHGFGVHASDYGAMMPDEKGWAKRLMKYGLGGATAAKAGGRSITGDVANTPDADIKQKAQELSVKITNLLEQENIASTFDSTVRGEVEEQAVASMLRGMEWPSNARWRAGGDAVSAITVVNQDDMVKWGGETFDQYGKSEGAAEALEYNLHMLARRLGPDFVAGVEAMETTNMTTKKYFQVKMKESGIKDKALAWEAGVSGAIEDLKSQNSSSGRMWNHLTHSLEDMYDIIGEQTLEEKQKENLDYFARQMLSRFAEIEAGQFGDAYIFHAPVSRFEAGYARIEPVIEDGFLIDVNWSAGIVGVPEDAAGNPDKYIMRELKKKDGGMFQHVGTAKSYASNSQILLWDAQTLANIESNQMATLLGPVYQQAANDLALRSGRQSQIGSSVNTELAVGLGNVVQGMGVAQAVEVLSTTQSARMLEDQIKAFFEDPKITTQFENFYEDATEGSEDVTTKWRNRRGGGQFTAGGNEEAGIWANEGGPFTSARSLVGMGIPFWFLVGRTTTGFEKFKRQQSHGVDKMAGAKISSAWQEYVDYGDPLLGIAMPAGGVFGAGGPMGRPLGKLDTPGVLLQGGFRYDFDSRHGFETAESASARTEGKARSVIGQRGPVRRTEYVTKTWTKEFQEGRTDEARERDQIRSMEDIYRQSREGRLIA